MLSPAFDGHSSKDPESADGRDLPKRGSSPYHPDVTQEKTVYPFPMSPAATDISAYGSERNLLTYPERTVSIASYYTYSSPPFVASNIAAVSTLSGNMNSLERFASPAAAGSQQIESIQKHSRENSATSLLSLPAPPRRTRTPPVAREPMADLVRSTSQSRRLVVVPPQTGPISPSSPQNAGSPFEKRETSVRARTPSGGSKSSTEDLDITGWLAKQNADGSMPRGMKNKPLLSAVIPSGSFPQPSPISAKSSAGPRPLLKVLEESDSSPIAVPTSNPRYNFI